jgi:hypothetical protein
MTRYLGIQTQELHTKIIVMRTLLFALLFLSGRALGQDTAKQQRCRLYVDETFVLKVRTGSWIMQGKLACLKGKERFGNLYKIAVEDVLYMPDSTAMTRQDLKSLKFINVIDNLRQKFPMDTTVIITCTLSVSKDFVSFRRLLTGIPDDSRSVVFTYRDNVFISKLMECQGNQNPFHDYIINH